MGYPPVEEMPGYEDETGINRSNPDAPETPEEEPPEEPDEPEEPQERLGIQSDTLFKYVVDVDPCEKCASYASQTFNLGETIAEFPNLNIIRDDFMKPEVHPNCRCQLKKIVIPNLDPDPTIVKVPDE
jgi:hypothetical protein